MRKNWTISGIVVFVSLLAVPASGFNLPEYSLGQVVYVPASFQNVSTTGQTSSSRLYIRNIDRKKNIVVKAVKFLNPDGQVVKNLLDGLDCFGNPIGPTTVPLSPLQTTTFITRTSTVCVPQYPLDGGRPAWIVEWESVDGSWTVAPHVSASTDILTPTTVYGLPPGSFPSVVIDAESMASGTVLSEKRY
jgi:hypothetical protein